MTIVSIQIREVFVKAFVFLLLLLMVITVTMANTFHRWIDENGKVHYSSSVPPSAAQGGHTEMNKSGKIVNNISSRSEREEKKRHDFLLEEKERKKLLIAREELSLDLFSSRSEIENYFERRLEMVSVNLRLLRYHKRKIIKNITKIRKDTSRAKTRIEKNKLSKRLQKMQSALLEHTLAIENNKDEQSVTNKNRKRALKKHEERISGKSKDDYKALEDYLKELKAEASSQSKSGCDCTCDSKKKR